MSYEVIFFDIEDTKFDPAPNDTVVNETKRYDHINFASNPDFWEDKKSFFMHGLGVLNIEEAGVYHFRLTSTGNAKVQLNNVDLILHHESHEKETRTAKRLLDEGLAIFDFEYFPESYGPYFVLEWSRDGVQFEPIPASAIRNASEALVEDWEPTEAETESAQEPNTLTDAEMAEGWRLLFDGKTMKGWHNYGKPGTIGQRWQAEDGTLKLTGYDRYTYYISGARFQRGPLDKIALGGGDIVSDEAFENFELRLEWKISKHGNSGIFYTVQEDPQYKEGYLTSPEMQILDNTGQKDGRVTKHRAGDLYDLIESSEIRVKPQGNWNQIRIIKNQGKIEHWLNGAQIVSYDLNDPEFKVLFDNSKFSHLPSFFNPGPGRISLQDHDDTVWFRNIKIKPLDENI